MLVFVTVPGFYAEVERALDPSLETRPVIVGGDPRKRGSVQSATADARAAGVVEGMAVVEALERCPRARAVRTNMRRYREASSRLRALLRRHGERMEPAGLEAAYLDPRGDDPELLGRRLQAAVADEHGWPLRVGIAPVKFLARLAAEMSDEAGEGGLLRIPREGVRAFLDPLPVECLPGVGPKTAGTLAELGARSVGALRGLDPREVEAALGNHGLQVLGLASGQDADRLRAAAAPRSLSQESTLSAPERDVGQLLEALAELARRLAAALALEDLAGRKVSLRLRFADGEQTSRSRTLRQAIASAAELEEVAGELLARTQAGSRPVRGLGLALGGLVRRRRDDRQLGLFEAG